MKISFSFVLALLVSVLNSSAAQVDVIRTPGGGIQPQAAVGAAQVRKFATASSAKSKHPAIAANKSGEILIAWAEGASWGKGGQLKWRLFDGNGKPVGEVQSVGELPAWSLQCVVAAPDGNFLVALLASRRGPPHLPHAAVLMAAMVREDSTRSMWAGGTGPSNCFSSSEGCQVRSA